MLYIHEGASRDTILPVRRALLILVLVGCASAPIWEPCANEICARCLGSGTYECDACESTAYIDCTSCRRGEIACVWCFGIGDEAGGRKCNSCLGKGKLECARCRGTTKAACRKCRGTGRAKCGRWIGSPNDASAPATSSTAAPDTGTP